MKVWFETITWDDVTRINEALCNRGRAQHGFSESLGPKIKKLWNKHANEPMTFWEMLQFCWKLHEGTPFFNYNGNTFAALAAEASRLLKQTEQFQQFQQFQQFLLDDSICNAIQGKLGYNEEKRLREISEDLEKIPKI